MAEDSQQNKTEQPTPRRLEKAREEGQVPFSQDLINGLVMTTGTLFFLFMGSWFVVGLQANLKNSLAGIPRLDEEAVTSPQESIQQAIASGAMSMLPLALLAGLVVLVAGVAMNGLQFSPKAISPDLNKLNPQKGIKRIFSSRSVVRGAMSIAKVAVIALATFLLIQRKFSRIGTQHESFQQSADFGAGLALQIAMLISGCLLVIGLLDLMYQKWKHIQDLKMSRQEIKDEFKEQEGDPHIKNRIKKVQRELAEKQMMKDVPSSTVILTNPTHIAIAIRYRRGLDDAPVVVAKGEEMVAKRIVAVARKSGVPILERKPLARAIYFQVQIGSEIPLELYQAVAEVLGYLERQKTILTRSG